MNQTTGITSSEINFSLILSAIKSHPALLIIFNLSLTTLAALYTFSLPDTYESSAKIAPHSIESSSYSVGLSSKLEGLTSLIGVGGLSDGGSKITLVVELMKSTTFANEFSENYNLLPLFFAAEGIEPDSGNIIFDSEVFDPVLNIWTREVSAPLTAKPNRDEIYEKYIEAISVSVDKESGYITISASTVSPRESKLIVEQLVTEISKKVSERERRMSSDLIIQLEAELAGTTSNNIKLLLTNLLEQQLQKHAVSKLDDYFGFSYIDEPYEAILPSGPPRLQILAVTIFGSFLLSILILTLKHAYWNK
ncbi:MAG: Wzz/FepE/Etk N-terminal domain-containing protein [Pseudomonadota bacterium]|nr:Wzz/FepE/Etk N-terminal domain-containing protein [Pseudomonadota bacterium]